MKEKNKAIKKNDLRRRDFLKLSGTVAIGAAVGGMTLQSCAEPKYIIK